MTSSHTVPVFASVAIEAASQRKLYASQRRATLRRRRIAKIKNFIHPAHA